MVDVGTGTSGTRFIKTDYPIEEGLTAGTNKLPKEFKLKPEISVVSSNNKVGI